MSDQISTLMLRSTNTPWDCFPPRPSVARTRAVLRGVPVGADSGAGAVGRGHVVPARVAERGARLRSGTDVDVLGEVTGDEVPGRELVERWCHRPADLLCLPAA